jgi:PAS domain S-box-containing protein
VSSNAQTVILDERADARATLRNGVERAIGRAGTVLEAGEVHAVLRHLKACSEVPVVIVRHAPPTADARAMIEALRSGAPHVAIVVVGDGTLDGDARSVELALLEAGASELVVSPEPEAVAAAVARARARWVAARRTTGLGGERQLASALEGLPVGIALCDTRGQILAMNARALRTHGFSSLEAMLHDLEQYERAFEVAYPDGTPMPLHDWPLARALRGEYVRDCEVRLRAVAGGEERIVSYTVAPLRSSPDGGEPHLFVVAVHDISERMRDVALRRESEERYRTLLEQIDDGFCIVHVVFDDTGQRPIDYRFVDANPAFEKQTGLSDVIGKSVRQLVPDLEPHWFELYGNVARTGVSARFASESAAMGRSFEVSAVRVGAPEEHRVAVLFTDVTERKAAERKMRESEARARAAAAEAEAERRLLDTILEAAPAGIIVADANGRLVRMNPANELLWGPAPYSEDVSGYAEWKGWWADGTERHGRRVEPHEWAMARALRGETVRDDIVEIEPFGAPGTRRTMVNSGAPVRDSEGKVVGAVIAQMNISALVEAEAAMRESEQRFRALADNIVQLAWIADSTGSIYWYNRRWYEFTGTTAESMLGWGWKRVHHPEHVDRVAAKFRAHVTSGNVWEDTFPLRSATGEYRWFLSRAVPIRDEVTHAVRWFGTNTDITDQRRAEDALREASRRKDEFLHMLAHELRNPLAPIRIAVSLLGSADGTPAMQERARAVIDRQVTHLTRLIDDLLDVSRVVRGRIELRKERCDLGALVRQTLEDHRESFAHVALAVSAPPEGLWVDGDPVRLAQAVGNLLHNAAKFTPRGGRVDVQVASTDTHAEVRVIDTGVGMDEELLARLFEPFSQADQGLARSQGGLGLGLALTRGLVELHGGTVEAQSAGVGRGSIFTVRLPRVVAARQEVEPARASVESKPLEVLLIEDNVDSAELLDAALSMAGYHVAVAHDGASGIVRARTRPPDVVISDIGLPGGVDGYDVARTLRAEPRLENVLLVALSGYCGASDRERSRDAGFDVHLAKPVALDELKALLAAQRPRAHAPGG